MNLPENMIPGRALIHDRELILAEYRNRVQSGWTHDEMWDGLLVLMPLPDNQHQELRFNLAVTIEKCHPHLVYPGVNISDRIEGWLTNFRCPDVCVFISGMATPLGTHWVGGPDFAVEIISEGEDPHGKFEFYAAVSTREVLVVERDPWAVELFSLSNGRLVSSGRSDESNGIVLNSAALGLAFKLVAGTPRPKIELTQPTTGKSWMV